MFDMGHKVFIIISNNLETNNFLNIVLPFGNAV